MWWLDGKAGAACQRQTIYAVFIIFFLANLLLLPLGRALIKTASR